MNIVDKVTQLRLFKMNRYSIQQCYDKDWKNPKEISNEEIAHCIYKHNLPQENVPIERKEGVAKALKKLKVEAKKDELDQSINDAIKLYPEIDFNLCQNKEQIIIIEESLKQWKPIAKKLLMGVTPRDTKHYSQIKTAYQNHLVEARNLLQKYEPNSESPVFELFDQLLDIGLPEPMTQMEMKQQIFIDNIYNNLINCSLSKTTATTLSKQIASYLILP